MRHELRIFALSTALALFLAWPLLAQTEDTFLDPPRCNDLRAIAKVLELTEEQIEETRAIFQRLRETVRPLYQEIASLREELQTLLDSDNPPPGQVGQIVIDIHRLRNEIRDAQDAARGEFEALLTAEQLARWREFQQTCRPGRGR